MVASTSEQINIVTLGLLGPESTVFACHHERILLGQLPGQNPEGPQITQKNSDRTTVTVPKPYHAVSGASRTTLKGRDRKGAQGGFGARARGASISGE